MKKYILPSLLTILGFLGMEFLENPFFIVLGAFILCFGVFLLLFNLIKR